MKAEDIMSKNPAYCTPSDSLASAARQMVENDCGLLPVVDNTETLRPVVGVVTDRDIVCRTLAVGVDPLEKSVRDCMSDKVFTVKPDDSVEDCVKAMETHQVRRLPVVDDSGACVGIVTQAHIARVAPYAVSGELLNSMSKKTRTANASTLR